MLSVDAETADGSVNLVLVGEGELPSLEMLEDRARGVLFGRTLRVKVLESRTLYPGTKPAHFP